MQHTVHIWALKFDSHNSSELAGGFHLCSKQRNLLGWLEFFTHALKLLRMIGITNVTLSCLTNMHREI